MDRPVIVYDDVCGFCTWSARRAEAAGEFDLVGFSELTPALERRLPEDYERCAHLVTADRVYSCGAAAEEVLARMDPASRTAVAAFRLVPDRERVREPLYRWVADHRDWFGRLLR
ncbi:thiol-disulfide oxidoreductase DCC family protein [Halobacteriaceae archaeon GCM10025711]